MKKKENTIIIIAGVVVVLLFLGSMQNKESTETNTTSNGEDTFTVTGGGGGGGGSGGVPPSGDPDEPCENCDLFWVENKLSDVGPSFAVDEFLTKDGRLVPSDGNQPAGHWECRGDCPDKNGYPQKCIPKPKLIDPADFNDRPTSKADLEQLMDCYCVLEDPCHMEYGNIFCERGIPENILTNILSSNSNGKFMDIEYSKIREHCSIARCEGGCTGTGEECVFVTERTGFGDFITTCECTSDDCHKVPNFYPTRAEIRENLNYGVTIGETVQVKNFISTRLEYNSFKCDGTCVDGNEQCAKEGDDCVCKAVIDEGTPSSMPVPQPCNAIQVNGDDEWYKCLKGYCNQVPYCYPVGVDVAGWYLGSTLIRADSNCAGAVAYCSAIGTRSQGWYSSYDRKLITYDSNCDDRSTCFYNTYSNSCECTPYTSDCAWHVDWANFQGQIRDSNHPQRYCDGSCYQINYVQECVKYQEDAGEVCKCVPAEGYEPENDMDNDGIPDNEDSCPTQFGYKLYNGCPSTLMTTTNIITKTTTIYDSILR